MNSSIINEVIEQMRVMPQHLQWQVLEFTRTLVNSQVHGILGQQLLRFAGTISLEDLNAIQDAIEYDCGKVDIDEW
ncbi:MAG TPA: hypothetical protein DEG17_24200 [Cyanobacteria bacterium UBA11149]|nr:hypothetical protein [Cyanobacteria bacterium UBA11367]HBE60618.1 hypothetical protein [Cyanobacteria bacterium UBA11366]HBK64518.1 hypothetical protein [Cyanobacteria bacterium UBA11166]HBR73932.1 hypothetical protein [Cyanobacteria bacterium UBA11159]HBS72490.1 hypothetical protein [Cyanobacteria bacterium UBA11153]HBW91883.1 hypothetical protein [Cyanobacteria bacterium UBA11149]HCA96881.1 hypothetical protein [Cyanobacteria bacterium UBA9226]